MHRIKRIPLEERLKSAKRQTLEIPGIFSICLEDYYCGIYYLSKGLYNISKDPCITNFHKERGLGCLDSELAEFLSEADNSPEVYKDSDNYHNILYHILIEPFVRIEKFERRCDRDESGRYPYYTQNYKGNQFRFYNKRYSG